MNPPSSPSILYLHGFRSSPASWKIRQMGEALAARGLGSRLDCPALSHVPLAAIAQAEAIIAARPGPVTLVGSSLGDRKSTRLNSSHIQKSRMPSSA